MPREKSTTSHPKPAPALPDWADASVPLGTPELERIRTPSADDANNEDASQNSFGLDAYREAFSRNVGWLTEAEQLELRGRRIAIAGLGGVGGFHLRTLTRLGIGGFHIADLDRFELANFNRQVAADINTIGRDKAEVLAEQARAINPSLALNVFNRGVTADNLDAFLDGVDLYVDGLDFFCLDIRRRVFAACHERGIPAVTAAPLGMGVALLNFLPGKMTFEQYFGLEGRGELEQYLRFALGLSPSLQQQTYLADASRVSLAEKRGPSTPMACQMCAGVVGTQALKILLNRGQVIAAPRGLHFDAYRNRTVKTWRPGGHRNPLSRLTLAVAKYKFRDLINGKTAGKQAESSEPTAAGQPAVIDRILDLARWAPSGDNTQPWRFEVHDDARLTVHGCERLSTGVYDQRGHCHQLMMGVLLETLEIAASGYQRRCIITRRAESGTGADNPPVFDVELVHEPGMAEHALLPFLMSRTTQRKAMSTRAMSQSTLDALSRSVGEGFSVKWMTSFGERFAMAKVNADFAQIRMTQQACHEVHSRVIAWGQRESKDRLPGQGLGMDPLLQRVTQWLMKDWRRIAFMNRYLAGSVLPRLQIELLPGVRCAGHFAIVADHKPEAVDARVAAGRAFQRLWLTATKQSLLMQPGFTPILFGGYARDGFRFLDDEAALKRATACTQRFDAVMGGADVGERVVALGRVGYGPTPTSRSVRLGVDALKA